MILYITDRNIRVYNADNQISYNSDYIAEFRFDDEWNGKVKTARFVQNGEHVDVVLVDDRCEIPPLKTGFVRIGVFSDSMTSTYADVYFKTSIKDGSGNPTEPPEDVYAQLTALIESGILKGDDGLTPYVGSNNNWWIGDIDTGALARGTDGEKGDKGDPFTYEDFTPKQLKNLKGADGYTPVKGVDYFDGEKGDKGDKGDTPVKGVDYFTASEVKQIQNEVSGGAIGDFKAVVDEETATFNTNAENTLTDYNANAQEKFNTYNANADSKFETYNTNAEKKLSTYNSNATEKFKAYNDNHVEKMTAYDTNATDKLSTYNRNATEKLTTYDTNAEQHTTDYNRNAAEKLEAYNQNHTEKVAEYNQNAETKKAEFDSNAAAIRNQVTDLKSDLVDYYTELNHNNILKNPIFNGKDNWITESSSEVVVTDTIANAIILKNTGTEIQLAQIIPLSELESGNYTLHIKRITGNDVRLRVYTRRENGYHSSYLANVVSDTTTFSIDINTITQSDPLMKQLVIIVLLSTVGESKITQPYLGITSDYNGFWNKNYHNHDERISNHDERISTLEEMKPVLFGKKIVFCGDSFTEGDFTGYTDSNGKTGTQSDAYDSEEATYKTYPYWIAKRTGCNKVMMAKCGYKLTSNSEYSFTDPTSQIYYQNIPLDADYIVIQFGLNDMAHDNGTWESTDTTTWQGAFNVVMDWITYNIPKAKVLFISSDAWMTYEKRQIIKKMAIAWGAGFLDLKDINQPMMLGGKYAEDLPDSNWGFKDAAKNRYNGEHSVTSENGHPNVYSHICRSYAIQNALEKLQ